MMLKLFLFLIVFNIYLYLYLHKKYIKKKKYQIINSKCKIIKKKINKDMQIIEIYNFLNFTKKVISFYHNNKFKLKEKIESLYPGSRAKIHPLLNNEILHFMLHINQKYYKFKGDVFEFKSVYSVPDFKKEQYNLQRSLPHQDNIFDDDIHRNGLALTLYFCEENPNYGGTIIYKLKNKNDLSKIMKLRINGKNKKFDYNYTTQYFDVLYNAKLKFNKAVIYPSHYWHNANIIPKNYNYNKNRLTITAFLTFDKFENENENEIFEEKFDKIKKSRYYL